MFGGVLSGIEENRIQQSTGFLQMQTADPIPVMDPSPVAADAADGPFQYDDKGDGSVTIRYCRLMFGRTLVKCDDQDVTVPVKGAFDIWAVVSHPGMTSLSLSVNVLETDKADEVKNTATETYRLLYTVKDGGIVADMRNTPTVVAMA